jgi:V8-like Glu-specific endopeptidase
VEPVGIPDEDQLDYALLRLDGSPGGESIGKSEPGAPTRGWIKIPEKPYDFAPDSALLIVQHPSAGPLKLALDTQAIRGLNENGTRVKYRTNTEAGSSGSPCFNINWELVALHHAGDPNFSIVHQPEYNQGIPFHAIYELLKKRNLLDEIQN